MIVDVRVIPIWVFPAILGVNLLIAAIVVIVVLRRQE